VEERGGGGLDENERSFVVSQCPHYCSPLSIQREPDCAPSQAMVRGQMRWQLRVGVRTC